MRGFIFSGLIALGLGAMPMAAFAQVSNQGLQEREDTPKAELMPLGGGLFLEIIPGEFVTVQEEIPKEYLEPQWEWVTIPATFETVTEKIIIQDGYSKIKMTPADVTVEGGVKTKAKAAIVTVPQVTADRTLRIVKTPARLMKRMIPSRYHPRTFRKRITPEIYIIRDETGAEVKRYDDPAAFAEFVNGL